MKFYNSAVIIILIIIVPCITLADKPQAVAQSQGTEKSNSKTLIPDSTSIGSSLTLQEVEQLLQLHNKARADVGVGPLSWSKNLAIYAQEWADHLASAKCRMEHRPESGQEKQEHGENLFMGTAGYYGVADAVKAWVSEKEYYRREALNASNWHKAGHYTQIVWKNTKDLGCAKVTCKGNIIVVCNYDPPGNVLGQKPY
jgi:pathogenesis-related protein 1